MDEMTKLLLTALKHWDRWDGEGTISGRDEELLTELIDGLWDGSIKLLHLTAFGNHGTTGVTLSDKKWFSSLDWD